jgi:hypothetical protein
VGREKQRGTVTRDLLERASEIVEQAAIRIESETDPELAELLSSVRAQVARGQED